MSSVLCILNGLSRNVHLEKQQDVLQRYLLLIHLMVRQSSRAFMVLLINYSIAIN